MPDGGHLSNFRHVLSPIWKIETAGSELIPVSASFNQKSNHFSASSLKLMAASSPKSTDPTFLITRSLTRGPWRHGPIKSLWEVCAFADRPCFCMPTKFARVPCKKMSYHPPK